MPLRPYQRPNIKDPGDDPVIAMARARHQKELNNDKTKRMYSGVTGTIIHKELELKQLESEIKALTDGVQEYQDQMDLLNKQRVVLEKRAKQEQDWCDTFDSSIGPFEEKYEESKAMVRTSYEYAKGKYKESLQKLIDDFGFHPTFKRWFDEF